MVDKMRKKAQVTIFIIIGVILVSVIALFFVLRTKVSPEVGGGNEINPNLFLQSCIENKIKEGIQLTSTQGGYIQSPNLSRRFKFENENDYNNLPYLCYNVNYYIPCINQEPMLIQHIKRELKGYILPEVDDCFYQLGKSLEKKGFIVEARYNGFDVDLVSKKFIVSINAEITLTKNQETLKYKNFKVNSQTYLYELSNVVQEIVSQEARFCNFDQLGYMIIYPEFNIDKFRTGDSDTIYTIKHRDSKEKFRFIVRSCVIPPGI